MKLVYGIIGILLLTGCSSNDRTMPEIRGNVYNAAGEPVNEAGILFRYHTEFSNIRSFISLRFALNEPGYVRIWITPESSESILNQLYDGEMNAGLHNVNWDGRDENGIRQINGFYLAHLEIDGELEVIPLLLNTVEMDGNEAQQFNNITDTRGFFAYPEYLLPCNSANNGTWIITEDCSAPVNLSVNRYIDIWVFHPDYGCFCQEMVYVPEGEITEVEIILE